jgi:glutamate/aspartate transport system substrate-binding protein
MRMLPTLGALLMSLPFGAQAEHYVVRTMGQDDFRSVPQIEQGLQSGAVGAACALLDSERRRKVAHMSGKPYTVRHRLAAASSDRVNVESVDELVRLKPLLTTSRGAAYTDQLRVLGLEVDDSTGDNLINMKKILAGHGRFVYISKKAAPEAARLMNAALMKLKASGELGRIYERWAGERAAP